MRLLFVVVCAFLLAFGIACGSDDDPDPVTSLEDRIATPTSEPVAAGTLTNAEGWPRVEGLRGGRYCEVLLARVIDSRLNAEVWNSYGLNDCPEAEWKALDTAVIKGEHEGVLVVLLNGPRYWLMDAIERKPADEERVTAMFGAIEMFRAATVDIGPIPPNLAPYTERRVARDSIFEYADGAEVYELLTSDGRTFIMQSYSQQNDPTLTESSLPGIAEGKIVPPAGWSFRTRTLEDTLRVRTVGGVAVVLQDELSNTYQLVEATD